MGLIDSKKVDSRSKNSEYLMRYNYYILLLLYISLEIQEKQLVSKNEK